jgi:hypothetical protein
MERTNIVGKRRMGYAERVNTETLAPVKNHD